MRYIGKYKIRGLLGRGGMSKVFKVELPMIGKIAALKMLDPDPVVVQLIGMQKLKELFTSEAIKLANLRHPNIVEIWDFDESDGRPYYLMDYYFNNLAVMIGETSRTDQPSRVIRLDKAIHYIRQTLSGLACLHHAGLTHRDIKPYNLLLTDQEVVKICDFGLSKLRGETISAPSNLKIGSAWYAPPEQEENPENVDFRADLYAVGVTLYRMLTGILPAQPPVPPSKVNPDLDQYWDAFILGSIARLPQRRHSVADEMLTELDNLEDAWQKRKEKACRLVDASNFLKRPRVAENLALRNHPVKVNPRQAKRVFAVDDLWRPLKFIKNRFKRNSDDTVADDTTGLIWQQSGSLYPLTWHQARRFIEHLNQQHFAHHTSWRLPTIDELMSLLTTTPHGEDFCIESVFDPRQTAFWSADRRSYTAAWYVSIDMGFIAWQDFSAYYYVKGVCEQQSTH